jgi:glucosamine kinase
LLLVAGTGSIAWGRGEDGREARVGGWGGLLGDEGSGYDIGLRALRAVVRAADGRGPPTELRDRLLGEIGLDAPEALIRWAAGAGKASVARLAPTVCGVANAGDEVAAAIVTGAVESLKAHVVALRQRLGPWRATPRLALAGGLLAPGGPLREAVVASTASFGCAVREEPVDVARGAARLALRQRGPGAPDPGAATRRT